jgi:hypothetical protein
LPKNRYEHFSSAECDEHVKAADKRRARRREDQRHEEMRQLRDTLRDDLELDGRQVPDWQVQLHAARKIMTDEQRQAADE